MVEHPTVNFPKKPGEVRSQAREVERRERAPFVNCVV